MKLKSSAFLLNKAVISERVFRERVFLNIIGKKKFCKYCDQLKTNTNK